MGIKEDKNLEELKKIAPELFDIKKIFGSETGKFLREIEKEEEKIEEKIILEKAKEKAKEKKRQKQKEEEERIKVYLKLLNNNLKNKKGITKMEEKISQETEKKEIQTEMTTAPAVVDIKKVDDCKGAVNRYKIKKFCKKKGVSISVKALDIIEANFWIYVLSIIRDTNEMNSKVILEKHIPEWKS